KHFTAFVLSLAQSGVPVDVQERLIEGGALARALTALEPAEPATDAPESQKPTHRHKKRGSEYVLLGYGKVQAEYWVEFSRGLIGPSVDMSEVAIYRDVNDGSLWVR